MLTKEQRDILDKVKAFVMENRKPPSLSHFRAARLAMKNEFPARERTFINKLSEELHLSVRWDEYDDEDNNVVTWRFPGALETSEEGPDNGGNEDEWEDMEGDEESHIAVDRVLNKYDRAPVQDPDAEGDFDARYEKSLKDKMDEWKRGYYRVSFMGWQTLYKPFFGRRLT